jgi:L-iditol 2-dehydrogenase
MTAAVLYGKEDVKIEQVPIPKLDEGEVLVKVQVALTCGTDLKVYQRGYHARMIVPPALFGHELAGVIEEIGTQRQGIQEGNARGGVELRALRHVFLLLQASGKSVRRSAVQ